MSKFFRGRLKGTNSDIIRFISSIEEDKRIIEIDIELNQAHTLMLHKQGIVNEDVAKKILFALEEARSDYKNNKFKVREDIVDIHPLIEKYVIDKYGILIGGYLHIAKSRNDQVATDIRIYTRNEIIKLQEILIEVINSLLEVADKHRERLLPAYTHTQQAQLTTYAHYLLSIIDELINCNNRLFEVYKIVNLSPLGAAAIVGTTFNIDRYYVAHLLGFDGIVENSIEATSSRTFAIEVLNIITIIMIILSRIAADLIDFSTTEYNFIKLPDEYCDISSAMPHKRNPDVLETIRAATTKVINLYDNLANILTGLRTGYNKDLQVTKKNLFEAFDIVKVAIIFIKDILCNLEFNTNKINEVINRSPITATELTEYLVKNKNVSFREAYNIIARLINKLEKEGKNFKDIGDYYESKIKLSKEELTAATSSYSAIKNKKSIGSPNPQLVKKAINKRKEEIKKSDKKLQLVKNKLITARCYFEEKKATLIVSYS